MDSIFTRIIKGEIPSHKVFADDRVYAFLDINPIARGHTLVVPREQAQTLDQLSDESAAAVGRALPRICRAVLKASGASAYNILQNNGALAHQAVMHVHFHIIPKYGHAGPGSGLGIQWPVMQIKAEELGQLAKAIVAALD